MLSSAAFTDARLLSGEATPLQHYMYRKAEYVDLCIWHHIQSCCQGFVSVIGNVKTLNRKACTLQVV